MAKYIDADRLREKLTERLDLFKELSSDTISPIRIDECKKIIGIIDSLQQEQPEVDLDEEIDNYFYPKNFKRVNDGVEFPGWHVSDWKNPNVGKKLFTDDLRRFARHFYELGFNARKV